MTEYHNLKGASRRSFLKRAAFLTAGVVLSNHIMALNKKSPVILIVSGWQDVNIGDIAHTPGLIALIKENIPTAKIILWKMSPSDIVEEMLKKYYPDVEIIQAGVTSDFEVDNAVVKTAFSRADIFIHGSGPYVVAADFLEAWTKVTNKPFGLFGVTIEQTPPELLKLLKKAAFIFTRETASLAVLRKVGISGKGIDFSPDATFSINIHDTKKAQAFLQNHGLKSKEFICVIPRLRITPYYEITDTYVSPQRIAEIKAVNNKYKEIDHAKLREVMIAWVRKTHKKVLLCPEMTYQVNIMDELLIDPLPLDVKPFIVKHDYWLPDEAASVYEQAHSVISMECHSPIIAMANGTPAFYLRQPTDTIKGQMYYDLGLKSCVFEIDKTKGSKIVGAFMETVNDYYKAKKQVADALLRAREKHSSTFKIIDHTINS